VVIYQLQTSTKRRPSASFNLALDSSLFLNPRAFYSVAAKLANIEKYTDTKIFVYTTILDEKWRFEPT